MTAGTGLTGNVGGPLFHTVHEDETMAATEWMRSKLGIQNDTLDKPFSQIDRDATWNYKSSSNNPTLAPMVRVRVSTASTTPQDTSWTEEFNHLLDLLPADVRESYLAQSKLPPEQRDPAFGAFDAILGMTAKALTMLKTAGQPADPAREVMGHQSESDALPGTLRSSFLQAGKNVVNAFEAYLMKVGHSSPQFDGLSRTVTEMKLLLSAFHSLVGLGNAASKESWSKLAKQLDVLSNQLKNSTLGDSLQALRASIEAMGLIASATSLEAGAPSLMLALSLATVGLGDSGSPLGVLPPVMEKGIQDLSKALLATLMPNASAGSEKLLPLLVTSLLISGVGLAMQGRGNELKLEMGLSMLDSSGFLSAIGTSVASASGVPAKDQAIFGDILSFATVAAMLITTSSENAKAAEGITETLNGPLGKLIENIGQFMTQNNSNQQTASQEAQRIDVLLQQLKIALQELDQHAFVANLSTSAGSIDEDAMRQEKKYRLDNLRHFVDVLSIIAFGPPQNKTGTNVVMA